MAICAHPHETHGERRVCSLEPGHAEAHNNGIPEGAQLFEVVIKASGEVRDAEGNLISASPIESTLVVTEDELANPKE